VFQKNRVSMVMKKDSKTPKDDFIEFLVDQQSSDIQKDILKTIIEHKNKNDKTLKILIELIKKSKK
tara:strand:+ start:2352 stop:2549 length:198 start_codon:yes stop_codon:yes gene_type:complete